MKAILLVLMILVVSILWPADLSYGACPEEPYDSGICDTLYAEVYPHDTLFTGPGYFVRVPVYITHDILDPIEDSLAMMVIPLCYTHTNPTKYCSLSSYWNTLAFSGSALSQSIFRNLDSTPNRFLNMYADIPNPGSDFTLMVSTQEQHFWFTWIGTNQESPRWGDGSRDLAFTITFKVEDTMTVCVDTCFFLGGRYAFYRSDAHGYVPRDNLSCCFRVFCPVIGNPTRGINGDCEINVSDIVFLIGYLYHNGPPPKPMESGDANCDGIVDVGDVIYLINYLFKGGPAPSC